MLKKIHNHCAKGHNVNYIILWEILNIFIKKNILVTLKPKDTCYIIYEESEIIKKCISLQFSSFWLNCRMHLDIVGWGKCNLNVQNVIFFILTFPSGKKK